MTSFSDDSWAYQWSHYEHDTPVPFEDYLFPYSIDIFKDKTALDCGCGSGYHGTLIAPTAKKVVGFDLTTHEIAKYNVAKFSNVEILQGNAEDFKYPQQFDIVYSFGVLHHTDHPSKAFFNIGKFVASGGLMLIYVYSYENNVLARRVLEPLKINFLHRFHKSHLALLAKFITILLYAPVYTLYLLPIKFLPYYQFFRYFRKLSFQRNVLNVFDQLNAPTTHFIKYDEVKTWFEQAGFKNIHIDHFKQVGWRASGWKNKSAEPSDC